MFITIQEAGMLFDPPKSHRQMLRYTTQGLLIAGKPVFLRFRWNGGAKVTTKEWVIAFQEDINKKRTAR